MFNIESLSSGASEQESYSNQHFSNADERILVNVLNSELLM